MIPGRRLEEVRLAVCAVFECRLRATTALAARCAFFTKARKRVVVPVRTGPAARSFRLCVLITVDADTCRLACRCAIAQVFVVPVCACCAACLAWSRWLLAHHAFAALLPACDVCL